MLEIGRQIYAELHKKDLHPVYWNTVTEPDNACAYTYPGSGWVMYTLNQLGVGPLALQEGKIHIQTIPLYEDGEWILPIGIFIPEEHLEWFLAKVVAA